MKRTTSIAVLFLSLAVPVAWGQDAREQALLQAIQANPSDTTAHFNLGVAYFNEARYDLASEQFQKCAQLNPNDLQARELLESSSGISDYGQGRYSQAVDHFKKVLEKEPGNENANLLLGDSYCRMRQYKDAESVFRRYAASRPTDGEAQKKANLGLAKVYMEQDPRDDPDARKALEVVLAHDPTNFEALQNLGFSYYQAKDYPNAAEYWGRAVRVKPDPQLYKFLGFSLYNSGDFNGSVLNYKKSIELSPKDSPANGETYYNLGVAYNDNALYDEAVEAFDKAFQADPKDSNALVGKAQAVESAVNAHMENASRFLLDNRTTDAIAEWQKVLVYQPGDKQALDFIADAQGKLNGEVEKLYSAGMEYYQGGDDVRALTEWHSGLEMDPGNDKITSAIGMMKDKSRKETKALQSEADQLYYSGDLTGAASKYARVLKASPSNGAVKKKLALIRKGQRSGFDRYYGKGKAELAKGSLKEAMAQLRKAQEIDPNDPKLKEALLLVKVRNRGKLDEAVSLYDAGNKEKAKELFVEVLGLEPDNKKANDYVQRITGQQSQEKVDSDAVKSLYYEGVNLYINGKIREAIGKWDECLKMDPGNVNALDNKNKANAKLQTIAKLSHN